MEKILRQSLLYDFYGELLTNNQKSIYEDVVMNDLSYSEIARIRGISRQGVHDMVKRCDKILEGYEEKLLLVDKFIKAKEKVSQLIDRTNEIKIKYHNEDIEYELDGIMSVAKDILDGF